MTGNKAGAVAQREKEEAPAYFREGPTALMRHCASDYRIGRPAASKVRIRAFTSAATGFGSGA